MERRSETAEWSQHASGTMVKDRGSGGRVMPDALEARGASRGNAVPFPVKQRVYPQLALRASRHRARRSDRRVRHRARRSETAAKGTGHGGRRPPLQRGRAAAAGRAARQPPLRGGHGRPEVRPPGRLVAPWLRPRRPKPAGAMDGPAGVKFSKSCRARPGRPPAGPPGGGTASSSRSRAPRGGRRAPSADRRHARRRCRA